MESKELDNKTIISKLEELEPKMANWIKEQQNKKEKILILTLKNSNNKSIKLVINLNNLYLLGFINNQNNYFHFKNETDDQIKSFTEKIDKVIEFLGKKIKEKKLRNENKVIEIDQEIKKLKDDLNKEYQELKPTLEKN